MFPGNWFERALGVCETRWSANWDPWDFNSSSWEVSGLAHHHSQATYRSTFPAFYISRISQIAMTELSTPPPIPPRRSTLSISAQIPSTYTNGSAEVDAGLTDLPDQNLNTGKFKRLTRAYAVVRRFQETGGVYIVCSLSWERQYPCCSFSSSSPQLVFKVIFFER